MEVYILGDKKSKTNTDFWIDLQPANILFTVNSNSSVELLQESEFSYIYWYPGVKADNSVLRYLVSSQRSCGILDDISFSVFIIKIGDIDGVLYPC